MVKRKRSFKDMMNGNEEENDNETDKENAIPDAAPLSKRAKISDRAESEKIMATKSEVMDINGHQEPDDESKVEMTSMMVTVYVCHFRKCALKDKASETVNTFCRGHQQNVVKTRGRKYFWKCSDCGNRTQFGLSLLAFSLNSFVVTIVVILLFGVCDW